MDNFKQWLELMEPNLFTAKDPANAITFHRDDDSGGDVDLPLGMRGNRQTSAFPRWQPARPKKQKTFRALNKGLVS